MSYVDMIYVSVLDIPFSVSSSHKIVNQSVTESSQLHRRGEGNNYNNYDNNYSEKQH